MVLQEGALPLVAQEEAREANQEDGAPRADGRGERGPFLALRRVHRHQVHVLRRHAEDPRQHVRHGGAPRLRGAHPKLTGAHRGDGRGRRHHRAAPVQPREPLAAVHNDDGRALAIPDRIAPARHRAVQRAVHPLPRLLPHVHHHGRRTQRPPDIIARPEARGGGRGHRSRRRIRGSQRAQAIPRGSRPLGRARVVLQDAGPRQGRRDLPRRRVGEDTPVHRRAHRRARPR